MTATSPSTSLVDTAHLPNRRSLRFNTIDEALAEADRLAAAERAGDLRRLGNWTLGQALGHLAAWADYSYTGAPLKPPLLIKLLLRLGKRRMLNNPMRAGVKIPKVAGGTLATSPVPLDDGLSRFHSAMEHLSREAPTVPNVIFGPLTHAEWIQLNLRHAELHLSFFEPAA